MTSFDHSRKPWEPQVSVICPFYNEQGIIRDSVQRMISNLRQQFGDRWELILVNDGSTDDSFDKLRSYLEREYGADEKVRVVSYSLNQGRGRALKSGIDVARGNVIVTTEVDCSWGDTIVAELVDELITHPEADFVVASPHRSGGGLVNVPRSRVLLTKIGNLLIKSFFESQVTMNTGMTRAYRRGVIQPLVVHENGKEFHLEVLLKLLTIGFQFREIPATITWQLHKSGGGAKRRSSTRIWRTIKSHLRFIALAQPVRYFAYLAAAALLAGVTFMVGAFWALVTKDMPAAFLAIVGLNLLLFCLLFTGFSVLFSQLRDARRENWSKWYPGALPPSARAGEIVYPVKTGDQGS